MAEKTSLSLSMTAANGDKLSKAVTDVNPNASNSALNAFAQGLAGLTTNTLASVAKINKVDIDKTYTPVTVTRASDVIDGLPVVIDGNTITVTRQSIIQENYYIAHDSETLGLWSVLALKFTAGAVSLNQLVVPLISQPIDALGDLVGFVGKRDSSYDFIEVNFIVSADNSNSFSFNIIIPEGSSGSTFWETTSFTVNFV